MTEKHNSLRTYQFVVAMVLTSMAAMNVPIAGAEPIFTETTTVSDGDLIAGEQFGYTVAIDGDTAVVSAFKHGTGSCTSNGSVYVYVRVTPGNWVEQQKLTASDGVCSDQFGYSVEIFGDIILVGAIWDDDNNASASGSVYVYVRNGTTWSEQQKLTAGDPTAGTYFGSAIAFDGETALIGAENGTDGMSPTFVGAFYVFTRIGSVWTEQQKLTASNGDFDDRFGSAVALDGNTAIIGAYNADRTLDRGGSAYVFARTAGIWSEQQELLASDRASGDFFGISVALSGDTAMVVSPGANAGGAFGIVYHFSRVGSTWSETQKLTPNPSGRIGNANGAVGKTERNGPMIAFGADVLFVGGPTNDTRMGSVYIFEPTGNGLWTHSQTLESSDRQTNDYFGGSLAVSENHLLVAGGNRAAYLFELDTVLPNPIARAFVLPDINGNGSSDFGVAIPGSSHVHIRDGLTDALITDINFGEDDALQLLVLPDLNGNGDPEIAILNEQASGQVVVKIRDTITGAVVNNLFYGLQYDPVAMDLVADYSGNGLPEIAVLGSETGTDAVRVQIKDAQMGTFLDNIFLGTQSVAKDLVFVTDTGGNGIPEVGILGVLKANDHVRMQQWDAQTATFQSNVWFGNVYQPLTTITMPDINANGSDEIIAVGVDPNTQNIRVQVRDSDTTATLYNIWLGAVNEAIDIKLINDINNDGVSDLAVLLKTPSGTGRVRVQSGLNGNFIRNLFYTVVDDPVGLAVMPDYSGNGFDELAVLGESVGVRHVQILDTSTGAQVNRIDFP